MTDQYVDLYQGQSGNGRNPMTVQNRAAENAYSDRDEYAARKSAVMRGESAYPGPVDQNTCTVNPRELCFSIRGRDVPGRGPEPYVLSTLNGAFRKGDSVQRINEAIQFHGVAGGQGNQIDDANISRNNHPSFALVIAGTVTITNTTNKVIPPNAIIIWWAPDPLADQSLLYDPTRPGWNRIPLQIMAYDPHKDVLTPRNIGEAVREAENGADPLNHLYDIPSMRVSGARETFNALLRFFFIGLAAKAKMDGTPLTEDKLATLAAQLGLLSDGKPQNTKLRQTLMQHWFPVSSDDYLETGRQDSHKAKYFMAPETVGRAALWRAERTATESLLIGVRYVERHIEGHKIGRSLSGAGPKRDLDILLERK